MMHGNTRGNSLHLSPPPGLSSLFYCSISDCLPLTVYLCRDSSAVADTHRRTHTYVRHPCVPPPTLFFFLPSTTIHLTLCFLPPLLSSDVCSYLSLTPRQPPRLLLLRSEKIKANKKIKTTSLWGRLKLLLLL